MKRGIFLSVIILAVIALFLSPCPVAAKGKKFEGTWCRTAAGREDGPDLPFGWRVSVNGWIDAEVDSSNDRVTGQLHLYGYTYPRVEYDEEAGSEGLLQGDFILEPTAHAGTGSWYGKYECLYTVENGIRYHTMTLDGRGTGDLAGLVISMHFKHKVPGSLRCSEE